jgi:hypothetical protein
MKRISSTSILILNVFLGTQLISAQMPSAQEIVDRSIAYHDPNNNWEGFKGSFTVEMETPSRPLRTSQIHLDFNKSYFKYVVEQADTTTEGVWNKGNCSHKLNDSDRFTSKEAEKHRLNCDRTTKMKDYYTYLYGLPMKIKDPGTILSEKVEISSFHGEAFYKIRVDYEEGVGKDVWYFYFDTKDFRLRHYQFYHDLSKNDGEYILLSEEEVVQGIKMPKVRAWYMNNDDRYLGTDVLYSQK